MWMLGSTVAALGLGGCSTYSKYLEYESENQNEPWLQLLVKAICDGMDYVVDVEGSIPVGLEGTLFRNGPGLFERNGIRKRNLLDGDGMIRALRFSDGQVRFSNAFVRTRKYLDEEKAGRYLYPTWTTIPPNVHFRDSGFPQLSQAGVTVLKRQSQLLAFDEVGKPYALNPQTLATYGEWDPLGGKQTNEPTRYKAHTKVDGKTGDWVLVGDSGKLSLNLHVIVLGRDGNIKINKMYRSPRVSYYHDFFWSSPYVIFYLQPAMLYPLSSLGGYLGFKPLVDCLQWDSEEHGILFIVDTNGERDPIEIRVPSMWMWHTLNTFTLKDKIFADFVGYDNPDHFLGEGANFRTFMDGREGDFGAPGTLRRFEIDIAKGRATCRTLAEGHLEFPTLHPSRVGRRHRFGYFAAGDAKKTLPMQGTCRIDTESSQRIEYDFGSKHHVGEPVFVPSPYTISDATALEESGWLLCEVLSGSTKRSFIAIFDAANLADGPLAKVNLCHSLPISFHGWWSSD